MIDIRKILNSTDQSMLIQAAISRSDGLLHLLYSDVSRLLASVANDFPEIAKVQSIGQSNEGRDILVLELTMSKEDTGPKAEEKSFSQSSSSESSSSNPGDTSEFV